MPVIVVVIDAEPRALPVEEQMLLLLFLVF